MIINLVMEHEILKALSVNGNLIRLVPNPTKEAQVVAVLQNREAIKWIKDPCQEALDIVNAVQISNDESSSVPFVQMVGRQNRSTNDVAVCEMLDEKGNMTAITLEGPMTQTQVHDALMSVDTKTYVYEALDDKGNAKLFKTKDAAFDHIKQSFKTKYQIDITSDETGISTVQYDCNDCLCVVTHNEDNFQYFITSIEVFG